MQSLRGALAKLDEAVFQVERLLLLVSLAMMTLLVSVDVVQRTFSRPVGKTDSLLLALLYDSPTEEQVAFVTGRLGPLLFWGIALVFFILATQASRSIAAERAGKPAPGFGLSAAYGAAFWALTYGCIEAVLWLFPSSVPGAQKFALGFMLWSGMLGASLATRSRRHIMLDLVTKKLDPGTARPFALLGGVVTFGFCAFLAYLGSKQLWAQVEEWRSGDGVGVYESLPIPIWISTLSVPVTFSVMALRFLGHGIHDFLWGPPTGGLDAHGIDLEELERGAPAKGGE